MKKFFGEFKKFITRGNVVDMAVGVTVGSAFTAIVNGLTNFVLKPLVNWFLAWILGKDSETELYTVLRGVYVDKVNEAGEVIGQDLDLANSIYIDWGSFINAILNFFIIAMVLFCIVKAVNNFRDGAKKVKIGKYTKAELKEMKAAGVKLRDKAACKAYMDEKAAKEAEAKAAAEAKAKEEERIAKENSTEFLLKQIRDLLKETVSKEDAPKEEASEEEASKADAN